MSCPTWKMIEGYVSTGLYLYRVSDLGTVESRHDRRSIADVGRWRQLKPVPCKLRGGYLKVTLCINGVQKQRYVHDLVLEAFVGPCPNGMECLHGDGNPTNNLVGNLRWGTRQKNVDDMMRHGRHFTPFSRPPAASELQQKEIMELHLRGQSTRAIAAMVGVSKSTVWCVVSRKGVYADVM